MRKFNFNITSMKYGIFTLTLAAILLLGAGCKGGTENYDSKPAESGTTPTSTAVTTTSSTPENGTQEKGKIESLELTGTALGKNMVQFNWKLPEGAKDPEEFRLVRAQTENPTLPPGYWFKQLGKSRSAIWTKLPLGEQHFRLCIWQNGTCSQYSNNIVVDVK